MTKEDKPYLDWSYKGMKVQPYDHPLRFLVTSQTEGEIQNSPCPTGQLLVHRSLILRKPQMNSKDDNETSEDKLERPT